MTTLVQLIDALANAEATKALKPVVKFNKGIEDMETYIDRDMMARVDSITLHTQYPEDEGGDMYEVIFDVGEFRDHNVQHEQGNYYDSNGIPCLTATLAGQYPSDGKESVYLMLASDDHYYELLDDNPKALKVVTLDADTIEIINRALNSFEPKFDWHDDAQTLEDINRARAQLEV